jgi:hypothetical protein
MTPERAAEMYERLVTEVLDAENVVTHDERIKIMGDILTVERMELAKMIESPGLSQNCRADCHKAMAERVRNA